MWLGVVVVLLGMRQLLLGVWALVRVLFVGCRLYQTTGGLLGFVCQGRWIVVVLVGVTGLSFWQIL